MTFHSNVTPPRFGAGAPPEEAKPEPQPSPTSLPPLSVDEINARIRGRLVEFDRQPCYRCLHTLAQPDPACRCCRNGHTPDQDGNFPEPDPED